MYSDTIGKQTKLQQGTFRRYKLHVVYKTTYQNFLLSRARTGKK